MLDSTLRERTLGQILDDTVRRFPDGEALVQIGHNTRQTWSEFAAGVDVLAKGLMALGIEPGEKVALWATNVPNWVALMFATARIGATLLAVNTNYRDSELDYLLRQSECETFVCIDGFLDYDYMAALYRVVPELQEQAPGELKSERFPHLRRVLNLGETPHPGILPLPEVLNRAAAVSDAAYEARKAGVSAHDVVNMQYTSGTTGFPKGVLLTHAGIGCNGYSIGRREELTERDRVVIPLPLFHCLGCVVGVLACVAHGATMIILETFSPERLMAAIQEEKGTIMYGVPSTYVSMLGHRRFPQYDFSSLRAVLMSGSVCPEPLIREVMAALHVDAVVIPYGLTECSPVITMTGISESDEHRCRSVGRPLEGIELELREPFTGRVVPVGRQGEICCRGYSVMRGYFHMPEATAETIDREGWLHTGDLGVMDASGYLYITGRIKDMIVRGGENIYPREIEEFLMHMPSVRDVQVLGIPSRRYGEDVAAFVIPREGQDVRPEDVRDFCRGRIAWHKIPRYVGVVQDFPRTANGKIQKFRLREQAAKLFPNVK
ncbi:AMP-binding protein [uncultured Mailhella sp.]|uniref:AMP-binding protein n=1 Tax=uncultured Mailhella sp. TaxID=1981031 RepID=UPI00261512D7|nr:AMP-binding protein [uncultured Mailhella sp.]